MSVISSNHRIDKTLCEQGKDIQSFAQIVGAELEREQQSITSVIELLNQFADQCENHDKCCLLRHKRMMSE